MASVTFVPSRIAAGDFVDVPVPGSGDNGKAVTYNHGTGLFVYTGFEASGAVSTHVGLANPHSQYLLASSYTAADVLAKLLTVDGSNSGLDADLLDGLSSAAFATAGHTHVHGTTTSLGADDHTQYLLASGSRNGAASQAQTFTNGIQIARGITGLDLIDNYFGLAYTPYIYQVDSYNDYGMLYAGYGSAPGAYQTFVASKTTDGDANGALTNGSNLAFFQFYGDDGSTFQEAADIIVSVDGSVSGGVVPARVDFYTMDSTGFSAKRFTIRADGKAGVNSASPAAMLEIIDNAAATVGLVVQEAASQTADAVQTKNSSSAVQFAVGAGGKLKTNQAAANTHTPSGATAKQLPIYDIAGTLLGYIPIYGSAW